MQRVSILEIYYKSNIDQLKSQSNKEYNNNNNVINKIKLQ